MNRIIIPALFLLCLLMIGTLWTGCEKPTDMMIEEDIKHISVAYDTSDGLVDNIVYEIAIDSNGHKWFGTSGGVSRFDGTTWTTYKVINSQGVGYNYVYAIAADKAGVIWFGVRHTFAVFAGIAVVTH